MDECTARLYIAFILLLIVGILLMLDAYRRITRKTQVWRVSRMEVQGDWVVVDVVDSYSKGVLSVARLREKDEFSMVYAIEREV